MVDPWCVVHEPHPFQRDLLVPRIKLTYGVVPQCAGGVCLCALFMYGLLYGFDFGAICLSVEEDRFACFEF